MRQLPALAADDPLAHASSVGSATHLLIGRLAARYGVATEDEILRAGRAWLAAPRLAVPNRQALRAQVLTLTAVYFRAFARPGWRLANTATNWTADRLAAATRELNDRLETVGSVVVERPDGVMELRVYEDPVVRDFIATIANRTVVTEGFSPLAGHLMYRLLEAPDNSLNLAALGDPNHEQEIQRLVAMGIVRFDGDSMQITDEANGGLATGNWRAADRLHCR